MSGVLFPDGGFLGYIDEDIELELLQAATAEEFTFHRLLGKGCNWVVFSASLASLPGREYALRMCYNDLISSAPGPIDSEEFAIMRSLRDCPSFVKLFSVFIDGLPMSARALLPSEVADTIIECGGIDRSCRFAVLQLYPSSGGPSLTLADFLTSFQPFGSVLPFHRFALIATNLLSILCALEERRILHGDIKLNNILLDTNLQLVLCDFGDAIVLVGETLM